jgi:hypothetical protein
MPRRIQDGQRLPQQSAQTKQPGPGARDTGPPPATPPQDDSGQRSPLAGHRRAYQQALATETAASGAAPEEVLIRDARGDWTPTQMVERKLIALLGTGPGVFSRPTEGPEDV